jgi:CRISPR/Cas system-associated exonuclease Cas4 (RecB family)
MIDARLTLEPKSHTYRLSNIRVPGVSEIMERAGLFDEIKAYRSERAFSRGTYIHQITALHDLGTLDETKVEPELGGYLEAWKRFIKESGFIVLQIEQLHWHPELQYAGTIDRFGIYEGSDTVIDIKSGKPSRSHHVQLAAYAEFFREGTLIPRRLGIYLQPNGRWKPEWLEKPGALQAWNSALYLYRWKAAA